MIDSYPLIRCSTHTYHTTTLGDRSFAVAGPRVWNSLPATIRQITSYGQLRQHLKDIYLGLEIAARCDCIQTRAIQTLLLTYSVTYTPQQQTGEKKPAARQLLESHDG